MFCYRDYKKTDMVVPEDIVNPYSHNLLGLQGQQDYKNWDSIALDIVNSPGVAGAVLQTAL